MEENVDITEMLDGYKAGDKIREHKNDAHEDVHIGELDIDSNSQKLLSVRKSKTKERETQLAVEGSQTNATEDNEEQ